MSFLSMALSIPDQKHNLVSEGPEEPFPGFLPGQEDEINEIRSIFAAAVDEIARGYRPCHWHSTPELDTRLDNIYQSWRRGDSSISEVKTILAVWKYGHLQRQQGQCSSGPRMRDSAPAAP